MQQNYHLALSLLNVSGLTIVIPVGNPFVDITYWINLNNSETEMKWFPMDVYIINQLLTW